MIVVILLMHPLMGLVFRSDPGAMDTMKLWVLLLCSPLAIVTTWAPVFAFTSGTANAYVMFSTMKTGNNRPGHIRKMLMRGWLNGGMLYLFSMISMTFLHHSMEFNGKWQHTLLTGYLVRGIPSSFSPEFLFFNDALAMLSVTGIVTTGLLCLLLYRGGAGNTRRNYSVTGGLAALIILSSAWLHGRLDGVFFQCLDEHRWGMAFVLKCLIGPRFSPMPILAYALFGVIFGIGLANGVGRQWFRRLGYGLGGVFLALFAMDATFTGFRLVELTWGTLPMKVHFLDMGLILIVATILLELSELSPQSCQETFARRTRILQRLGRVSLSIFMAEVLVSVFIMKVYLAVLGMHAIPRQPQGMLPFLAIIVAFWVCAVSLWERVDYRYGVEWFLIWINKMLLGHTSLRLKTVPGAPSSTQT